MSTIVENNWIQTEARSSTCTAWAVIRGGEVIHSDELDADDPSGLRAYEAGRRWAEIHHPGVAFHWRHRPSSSR